MNGPAAPPDLARFLREVVAVSERQRTTVQEQVKGGFAVWCDDIVGIPGVRLPYCSRPGEASPLIIEITRPDSQPKAPRTDAPQDEIDRHQIALAQWNRHRGLYEQLFGARRVGEGMELVVSTALMRGMSTDKTFDRHLIAAPAVVDLDERTGALAVRAADMGQLETNWLPPQLFDRARRADGQLSTALEAETLSALEQALNALCNTLGPDIHHNPSARREEVSVDTVAVSASPAVLLRRRESSALLDLLNKIAADLAAGGPVSEPFQLLLDPRRQAPAGSVQPAEQAALALPADDRQRKLIAAAMQNPHTVIQGPPGTGKTHTIANLLSALLAQGKRVMVTAENERALREVQGKMPESMQSLLLPLFRGGGADSLGSSVNDIIHRTNGQTPEELENESERLSARLDSLRNEIDRQQATLRRLADLEFESRAICGASMRLGGHLAHLGQQAESLKLVDRYLSPDGVLDPSAAAALVKLTDEVSDEHRQVAELSVPDAPAPLDSVQPRLREIDEALRALPVPLVRDVSTLVADLPTLEELERRLLTLPPANWSDLNRTAAEYSEAAQRARASACDVRVDVSVVGSSTEDPHVLAEACTLARFLCEAPIDGMTVDQLIAFHTQLARVDTSQPTPLYAVNEPASMFQACGASLRALQQDRTGLLDRYSFDLAVNGTSDVDRIVSFLSKRTDLQPPDSPPIVVAAGAPPSHELLEQAEALLAHLRGGGKFRGPLGVPSAVKRAAGLIAFVTVDGSRIDTLQEAEWAVEWLQHQRAVSSAAQLMQGEGIVLPPGVSLPQWSIAVRQLPEASSAVVEAMRIVLASRGTSHLTRGNAATLLAEGYVASVRALSARLEPLVSLPRRPDVRIAGEAVRGRGRAQEALRALEAAAVRVAAAALLPEPWRVSCRPLDVSGDDELARRLEIAALAVSIPGWARVAELSAGRVRELQEQVAVDDRRRQLRAQRADVLAAAMQRLSVVGVASAATQAAREALTVEDWGLYRDALSQIGRERSMQALVRELGEVRKQVASAHPRLLDAHDAKDPEAPQVLTRIVELERLRSHRDAVFEWKREMQYPPKIHEDLARLHVEVRTTEQTLADRRCWVQVARRLGNTPSLASALSALSVAVQKVPKTKTAASYPSRLRAVHLATREAAPAIPAWVLSVDRAAEILGYPPPDERFDVIIIDEASQAWFPAIFLYALADQVIVVGDDLQTSPSVNSGAEENIRNLAKTYLHGHRLEDQVGDDLSLYDIASTMTAPNLLEDHFRCVPEIIDISMRLSYAPNGKHLRPVRVRSDRGLDPIKLVRVAGQRSTTMSANDAEVIALAEAVVRCHTDPAYAHKTFGVVTVGGYPTAHLRELQSKLLDRLGPEAMASRELEIGTAAQFQGAERDVMFLSMLDVPDGNGRMTAKPQEFSGRNRRFVQQLNVAVSRARDQLWIFHSFDASRLHPGDTRKQPDARLVLLQPKLTTQPSFESELSKCDSDFERQVVQAIHGYDPQLRISTQVPALGYVIDIVLEDALGHRLAVECDGDKYHGDPAKVRADLYRERILERAGWQFYRFFASEWFADPSVHLAEISRLLNDQRARRATNPVPRVAQVPPPFAAGAGSPDTDV